MDITSEIIRERLPLTGTSQSEIAKMINVSPAQLTQYLNGNSSLNKDSLDKLIKLVGINLVVYKNRLSLAKEVAKKLAGVTAEELVNMSKLDMVRLTGFKQIGFYPEFSKEELNEIVETMAFDYEDTFSYFKSLVLFYKEAGEKENYTHTVTKNTWMKLAVMAAGGLLVGGVIGGIARGLILGSAAIGSAITFNAMKTNDRLNNNFLSGFVDLAMTMAKKTKNDNK